MRIALIDCPTTPLELYWQDVYFPDTPFPLSDFLHKEANEVRHWNFHEETIVVQEMIQELQKFQPVVVGINDHQSTNGLVLERLIKQMFPRALVFFSPTAMSRQDLLDKANHSAYRLRQRTRPVAGKIRFRSSWEDAQLFADLPPQVAERALGMAHDYIERYQLHAWRGYLPVDAFRRVLETLEILEDCFGAEHGIWAKDTLQILDIGSASWTYAPALYQFFALSHTEQPRAVFLTGIELDPYRLDMEGYSCVDHALSYVDPISTHSRYLNENVFQHEPKEKYDVVTLLGPYMTCEEHLMGGLPMEFFDPEKLMCWANVLHKDQGAFLVTHRCIDLYRLQQDMFASLSLEPTLKGKFHSVLTEQDQAFVSLIDKSC